MELIASESSALDLLSIQPSKLDQYCGLYRCLLSVLQIRTSIDPSPIQLPQLLVGTVRKPFCFEYQGFTYEGTELDCLPVSRSFRVYILAVVLV